MKFTGQGEVAVRVSLVRETEGEIFLRFSVRDTGIGIPADRQAMLFQKFTQVDASITRRYGGTGLGLAISKQLTELMGGEIGLHSDEGRGSEFWFTARLGKQQPGASPRLPAGVSGVRARVIDASATGHEVPRRHDARILLAEDNITNQQVALAILRKLGFRTDVVASGREALDSLRRIPYDLVLMDVQMPEMDGMEATRVARSASGGILKPDVPIIAITAHAMQGDREACLRAGMNDYLAKPVSPAALSRLLEKWLDGPDTAPGLNQARSAAADPSRLPESGAASVEDALPAFDEDALLDRLDGDRDLATGIVGQFLEDIPKQIARLRGFLDSGDIKAAGMQAHTIKGAASAVSGEALTNIAFAMEKACKAGDLESATFMLGELQSQFERLKRILADFKQ